jgi:hypothetical protein
MRRNSAKSFRSRTLEVALKSAIRFVVACILFLSVASSAIAQSITANGSSGAISIHSGDTVTINTVRGGTPNKSDIVRICLVGGASQDYRYLNGTTTPRPLVSAPPLLASK